MISEKNQAALWRIAQASMKTFIDFESTVPSNRSCSLASQSAQAFQQQMRTAPKQIMKYISRLPDTAWELEQPRTFALLGSTGSIGCSCLKVMETMPDFFQVQALAGGRNMSRLAEQAARWRPPFLGVLSGEHADILRTLLPTGYHPAILSGQDGYAQLAALPSVSTVLSAQVGAAGLRATLAAVEHGKVVCLANKESLVLAGALIRKICARSQAVILPVDSEHNALFQAFFTHRPEQVRTLLLTASGGPFRGWKKEALAEIRPEQALKHPTWTMGAKITIDSATLMNKGLEVLEAHALYDAPEESIRVLVHPQSLVHSLVEFTDGSLLAQMGTPDMRLPIAHCIAWPHCVDSGVAPLDLVQAQPLTFSEPDIHSFPCLGLALRALRHGGSLPVVMNAANEIAVELFLARQLAFPDIATLIRYAMDSLDGPAPETLAAIESLDTRARSLASGWAHENLCI